MGDGKRDQLDQRLSDILTDYKSWIRDGRARAPPGWLCQLTNVTRQAANVSASLAEASSRPALGDPAAFRRQVLVSGAEGGCRWAGH